MLEGRQVDCMHVKLVASSIALTKHVNMQATASQLGPIMPIGFDKPSVRLEPVSVIAGAVLALLLWLAGFLSAALFQRLFQASRSAGKPVLADGKPGGQQLGEQAQAVATAAPDTKHADDADLNFFKDTAEGVYTDILSSSSAPGGWTLTTDKKVDGLCIYRAFSRPLPNGTTEYLSVTITAGATAQEFAEFCLDDTARLRWDFMLKAAKLISRGDPKNREQVVTWLRSFPFGFLSDRLYKISRRVLVQDGDVYTLTKHSSHPGAEAYARAEYPDVTQIDKYYSHTRMRTVASPWRSDEDTQAIAVETLLLHHDELKVPENLARTAIRFGQFSYVRSMSKAAQSWVRQRRAKGVDSYAEDPDAFCCRGPTRSAGSGGLHTVPSAPALLNNLRVEFADEADDAPAVSGRDQSSKQQQVHQPQQQVHQPQQQGQQQQVHQQQRLQQLQGEQEKARKSGWARAAAWRSSNALASWWNRGTGDGNSMAASEASSLPSTPRNQAAGTPFNAAAGGVGSAGTGVTKDGLQQPQPPKVVLADPALLMAKGDKGGSQPTLQRQLLRVAVMAVGAGIAALLVAGDGGKAGGRRGRGSRGGKTGSRGAAGELRSHDIDSSADDDEGNDE